MDATVELFASREDSVVGIVYVEPEDCPAEGTHPGKLVHVARYDVESLMSAP